MRTIFLFFVCSVLFACSSQDDFVNETDANLEFSTASTILKNLQRDLNASDPDMKIAFQSSEVKIIDGTYYLVAKSGEYISTTLLAKDADGNLTTRGISCTSRACSNNNGCIPKPDGKSCTSCAGALGDCSKTVTSIDPGS